MSINKFNKSGRSVPGPNRYGNLRQNGKKTIYESSDPSDDITQKYFSKVVTSYATSHRSGDGDGDGPGSLANFLVCMGLYNAGMGVPIRVGGSQPEDDQLETYAVCVSVNSLAIDRKEWHEKEVGL